MKKLIFSCFFLFGIIVKLFAAETADTVINLQHPENVDVTVKDGSLDVVVRGYSGGDQYTFSYSSEVTEDQQEDWVINLPFLKNQMRKKRGYVNRGREYPRVKVKWFDNFYVGATTAVDKPAGMRGGWEIGVDNFLGLFWYTGRHAPIISLGAGLGYRSANFGKGYMLGQEGKVLLLEKSGEDCRSASSRLHLFRVTFPLMLTQYICDGFGIRVGGILNLNAYTCATTKIKHEYSSFKQKFTSLEQRFASVDLMGSLIFCHDLGVYVRWSPMTLFQRAWGPQFKVLSFGVNLFM